MLKKLIKYDMRALSKTVLPVMLFVFVLMIAVGALFGTLGMIENVAGGEFLMLLIPAAIGILTLATVTGLALADILIYARYYKNLMTDEGYLSFTLPVTGNQHLCSKLITAIIWFVIRSVITALGIAAALFVAALISGSAWLFDFIEFVIKNILPSAFTYLSGEGAECIPIIGVIIVLGCIYGLFNIFSVYYSLTVGARSGKSKLAIAILVLAAVNIAANVIMSAVQIPFNAINTADLNYFSEFLISVLPALLTYTAAAVYLFVSTEALITNKLNI